MTGGASVDDGASADETPTDMRGSSTDQTAKAGKQPISAGALLSEAFRRLRTTPTAALALVVAGVVLTGIDWLRLHDPVPTVGFDGVQNGTFSVAFGVVVTVLSRANVPPSALVGMKTRWLAWTVGLELLAFVAVVGAGAYALSRLLDVPLTASAVAQYAGVVALLKLAFGNANFEGEAIVLAIPLLVVAFAVAVRLFAFPGLLVAGHPVGSALRRSWHRTAGFGWALVGVVVVVGGLNHLLASVPVVGPLGSALVGAVHAGAVAAFLRRTDADG